MKATTPKPKKTSPKTVNNNRRQGGEWVPAFLATLRNTGNVRASCEKAGIARRAVYDWRDKHPAFAAQWKESTEDSIELLEAIADQRARSHSDVLLIFRLKALRPEIYRERWQGELTGAGGGPVNVQVYIPDNGRDGK